MTVALSLAVEAGEDAQEVRLEITARPSDFEGRFNVLEVWRSRSTQSGPFEELTAESYKEARLPRGALDPPEVPVTGTQVALSGKTLSLRLGEEEDLDILFTGVDPLTYADAAAQVTSKSLGKVVSYVDELGVLAIRTMLAGTGAAIRVLESEAAPTLRLPMEEPESLDFGHAARMPLITGQDLYVFVDKLGSREYFYRTRFKDTFTNAVSQFSTSFSSEVVTGVPQEHIAIGELDLVGPDGIPIKNQEVRIHSSFNGTIVAGVVMVGSDLLKKTDEEGHVEFSLVRGQKLSVAVIGTDLIRDIVVPVDPNLKRFNLLDPTVGVGEDVFKVQVPNITHAERRTL